MKNLSRLGILLGYHAIGLGLGQELQNALGYSGLGPQDLKSGDEAIAAKYGIEPGHTGIGVGAFGITYRHHFEVGLRAAEPIVEALTRTGDAAATGIDLFVEIFRFGERLLVTAGRPAVTSAFAAHIKIDKCLGARLHLQLEMRGFG